MIKINLGCGPIGAKGWTNFDYGILPLLGKLRLTNLIVKVGLLDKSYKVKWPDFRYFDIRHQLPYGDKSVKFIYCSHVLEHFEKWEALKILKECYRVLRSDGVVRIVVPDVEKITKMYMDNRDAEVFSKYIWGFDNGGTTRSWFDAVKRLFIRGHQWSYDKKSMTKLLKTAGFNNVLVKSFGRGQTPNLDLLDYSGHRAESLYLEASKNEK